MASNVRVTTVSRSEGQSCHDGPRSVSNLVNAAVLESLCEDALDLEALDRRAKEPSRPFEEVLEDLNKPDEMTIR